MAQWFFTTPRWIGWGCMISGALSAVYGCSVAVQYLLGGDVKPLWFGHVPMAFSTALLLVVDGLAIFWIGWLIREQAMVVVLRRGDKGFTTSQMTQLILAIISAGALVLVALIGALKR